MKKSLYSLMLFDEIIDRIDEIAYLKNTNRSQLINDILAEQVGLKTPEQQINSIINELSHNLSNRFTIESKKMNNSISFGKNLKYKYRPKINYTIDFIGQGDHKHAVLKVSSRSTSERLNSHLMRLFSTVRLVETQRYNNQGLYGDNYSNYLFVRHFPSAGEIKGDAKNIAKYLINYITLLDEAINYYFVEPDNETLFDYFNQIFK